MSHNGSSKKEEYLTTVTKALVEGIEIIRYKADPKTGFQRELKYERTRAIVRAAKAGEPIDPIAIAKLDDGRMVLVDGQHRLHAWKQSNYHLRAIVYPTRTIKDAARRFVASNAHAVKVSLGFRLRVDQGPDASWMRTLAEKYETGPSLIYNLAVGITGKSRFYSGGNRVNRHARELAERLLSFWTDDKRWNDRAYIYSSTGAVKLIGTMCGESTNPVETLKFMQSMDWSPRSRMGLIAGSGWAFQGKMYKLVKRAMARAGKDYIRPQDAKKALAMAKAGRTRRAA